MTLRVNYPRAHREHVSHALRLLNAGKKIALVTLVHIEGNAPYPVGSQMLVSETGEFFGQITGGCAESAIADQAVAAIERGENLTERYGLDSPYFDIQLPCGSGIDVFFDCQLNREYLLALETELDCRRSATRSISSITKEYLPNARLLALGQGPILCKLALLALECGFEVVCVAQNEDTEKRLLDKKIACHLLDSSFSLSQACDDHTAVVSLFHEHDLEIPLLKEALSTDVFYIGALGSKKTQQARLDSLRAACVAEALLARIHGPVGIDIGANTPSQIAISILAEVVAVLNDLDSPERFRQS